MTDVTIHLPIPAKSSPWANESICIRLRELWKDHSASQISGIIWSEFRVAVSRNSVVGRLHREKLTIEHKTAVHPLTRGEKKCGVRSSRAPAGRARTNANAHRLFLTREPLELKALRCAEIVPLGISLLGLEPEHCRYPYGDRDVTYCGHPKTDGSYCLSHFALTHGTGTPSERAATSVPALVAG